MSTWFSNTAPLAFVNNHSVSQQSAAQPPGETLSVLLHPCGVFEFPLAGRKTKPFLSPSFIKCLVVNQTSFTSTEGNRLRFSGKRNAVKTAATFIGLTPLLTIRMDHPRNVTTNDDVSTEGSTAASVTSNVLWILLIICCCCNPSLQITAGMPASNNSGSSYCDWTPSTLCLGPSGHLIGKQRNAER